MKRWYYWKCFGREICNTLRNPRRNDNFELRYAASSLWSHLTYPLKQLFYFLNTVWSYRDILWNDRDWDHFFMYQLFERKLRRMYEYTLKYGCHTKSEDSAKEQLIAAECCRRLYTEEYDKYDLEQLDKKWGKLTHHSIQTDGPKHENGQPMLSEMILEHEYVLTPEQAKEVYEERKRIQEREEYMRDQDLQMLGKILLENSMGWWE